MKKALCVGISYKGQTGPGKEPTEEFELAGAHSDVDKVCDLLTEHYNYDRNNITVLRDTDGTDPSTRPTRDNILAAMEDLVRGAERGDCFFFFFAGHGDQITNLDGTEKDEKDEIILPLDWIVDTSRSPEDRERYTVMIIDDEMNDIMVKKLPPGCQLTALFDSCHSGTMLDLPYERSYGPRSPSPESPVANSKTQTLERWPTSTPRTMSPEPHRPRASHPSRPKRETRVIREDLDEPTETHVTEPRSATEVERINSAVGRGPLELSYTIAPVLRRGRTHPNFRKGTWIIRGETLDDPVESSSTGAHAISWSACSDGQCGYEVNYGHENRSAGVMCDAFVDILNENPRRTYRDILTCLGGRLRKACDNINRGRDEKFWIMQEPQLGSLHKPDLNAFFEP